MRVMVVACKHCGMEKPTLVSCVEILTGNQTKCHQCHPKNGVCNHNIPKLKREGRIITESVCIEHELKNKLGKYRLA